MTEGRRKANVEQCLKKGGPWWGASTTEKIGHREHTCIGQKAGEK